MHEGRVDVVHPALARPRGRILPHIVPAPCRSTPEITTSS